MIKKLFTNSKFTKNVLRLMTGTVLAQVITIAISPILTRLYSPEDFSVFAMYTAVLTILSVIACLRFEIAIPIPDNDREAFELAILALISTFFITAISALGITVFSEQLVRLSNNKLDGFLWMLPLGVFFAGSYAAFQYWATRRKNFTQVAKTKISQSVSCGGTQLGLGLLGITPLGLLLGSLFQAGAGVISLGIRFIKDAKINCHQIKIANLKKTFITYGRFPKYSTWEALTNSAGMQIPIILIATYSVGGVQAGYLMLAMRLLSAPMSLIGGAVAQVFLSEAPAKYHNGELKEFTIKTVYSLFKVGILPILLVAICSPFFVPLVFGNEWARAGVLISWMSPWFLVQFIVSPVSMTLHIMNAQRVALLLQVFGVLLRVSSVYLGFFLFKEHVSESYAISGLVFYLIYLLIVLRVIQTGADKKN